MNKKLKSKKTFNKNLNKPFNIYNFHYFKTLNIFVLKTLKIDLFALKLWKLIELSL